VWCACAERANSGIRSPSKTGIVQGYRRSPTRTRSHSGGGLPQFLHLRTRLLISHLPSARMPSAVKGASNPPSRQELTSSRESRSALVGQVIFEYFPLVVAEGSCSHPDAAGGRARRPGKGHVHNTCAGGSAAPALSARLSQSRAGGGWPVQAARGCERLPG
jgi:hypothetical protein